MVKCTGYLHGQGFHLEKATVAAHRSSPAKECASTGRLENIILTLEFHAKAEMFTEKKKKKRLAPEITLGWETYSNLLAKGVVDCGTNCSLHLV